MSSITLSSATRQNLLVAQDTASLLSTTQNRLATGKKVNTALDSPSSFFTAQGLDNRAGDLSNILDSISNGVQVIQAANTGITSLQKLVDNAKSVANQALQATIGYSTKSNVSTTITGATASDLRGTTSFTSATAKSNVLYTGAAGGTTVIDGTAKLGGLAGTKTGDAVTGMVTGSKLIGTGAGNIAASIADGETMTVNGKTITFKQQAVPTGTAIPSGYGIDGGIATNGNGDSIVYLGADAANAVGTVGDLLKAIDIASGVRSAVVDTAAGTATTNANNFGQTPSSVNGSPAIVLKSSTGADLSVSGKADTLKALGLTTALGGGTATVSATRTTSGAGIANLIQDGSTMTVNGKTITFKNAPVPTAGANHPGIEGATETDGNGNSTVYLQTASVADVLNAIDLATGVQKATIATGSPWTGSFDPVAGQTASSVATNGSLAISTGTSNDLSISGTKNVLSALGLGGSNGTNTAFSAERGSLPGGLGGKTLTFGSLNNGTAVDVTFGDGTNGTVKSLDDLNAKLALNNMQASLDASGKLTISTTNDYASSTIGSTADGGTIGGSAASLFSAAQKPVEDVNSQNTRKSLLSQFNQILDNIKTTAQDASFNGVNLLNGDTLKLTFNEKGSSTMNLIGVTFDPAGLGLTKLGQGGLNEFEDISSTNKVITSLTQASSALRQQASTFGSNLSVVQNRQDFNKQIINVLQTGSSKLTDADLNEEAANSQALSTRQSLTVSALSLANQAQQSVLQLLR